jgi:LysR family hydrogen peroxide-inducible transcriptional activator
MDIPELRYFVAVAEAGNFTRAAERCHVSQPSLSQQIKKLEGRLGQALFQRLVRRTVLTDAGRLLLERAKTILFEVDDAERTLTHDGNLRGGRLSVGAIPTIAPYLLPAVVRELRRRRQDLELRLHEDVTDNLLSLTAAGELDLSLAALPIDREQMHVEPMFSEPLLVTVSRSHPLATKPKLALADIRDERFILLHEVHCLAGQIEAFCHDNKFSPKVACRSAQIATVQEMISLGQGLSMLPAMARAADTNKKRVYRELGKKTPTRTVVALWHRQRRQTPASQAFLRALRAAIRTFESAGVVCSRRSPPI